MTTFHQALSHAAHILLAVAYISLAVSALALVLAGLAVWNGREMAS